MRPIVSWLSADDMARIYTAEFWNDVEVEKTKQWWIADGNYRRCLDYLASSGLLEQYRAAERVVREAGARVDGGLVVADLAAGIGWTSAALSRLNEVREVHAVEISSHRLGELFEHAVVMMDGVGDKISRYLGSFYDVRLPDASCDLILMSQAFHHAEQPLRLLAECDRLLRAGGRIVLIGEHRITPALVARRFAGALVRRRRIVTDFFELFPPDAVLGDHYYRRSDYDRMFGLLGYTVRHAPTAGALMYVAEKPR